MLGKEQCGLVHAYLGPTHRALSSVTRSDDGSSAHPIGGEHSEESPRFDLLLLFTLSLLRKNTRAHTYTHTCMHILTGTHTQSHRHVRTLLSTSQVEHGGPVRASDLLKVTQQTMGRAGSRQVPWFLDQGGRGQMMY